MLLYLYVQCFITKLAVFGLMTTRNRRNHGCLIQPRLRPALFTRGTVRPGPHPVCFRTVSCSDGNLGCWLIPLFWGLAGLRDREQGLQGVQCLAGLLQTLSDAIYRSNTPPPYCAYKAVFFFFLRLVMLLVRTLDRHWFMFLSSYKCSDLQAGNIADCT